MVIELFDVGSFTSKSIHAMHQRHINIHVVNGTSSRYFYDQISVCSKVKAICLGHVMNASWTIAY